MENRQAESHPVSVMPQPSRPAPSVLTLEPTSRAVLLASHESVIGKDLVFTGDISGAESLEALYIEGTVVGNINLPGSRVTVGPGGKVTTDILARDLIVCGSITGNVTASDRLEIRTGGSPPATPPHPASPSRTAHLSSERSSSATTSKSLTSTSSPPQSRMSRTRRQPTILKPRIAFWSPLSSLPNG